LILKVKIWTTYHRFLIVIRFFSDLVERRSGLSYWPSMGLKRTNARSKCKLFSDSQSLLNLRQLQDWKYINNFHICRFLWMFCSNFAGYTTLMLNFNWSETHVNTKTIKSYQIHIPLSSYLRQLRSRTFFIPSNTLSLKFQINISSSHSHAINYSKCAHLWF